MQKKNEPVRLQKVLSESGIMSRRKAEEMIELGKVTVNGRKAKIGQKVDPRRDIIAVVAKKSIPASIRRNTISLCTSPAAM